ncbi:MAG: hypothetical protein ABIV13_04765 [Fimbriimonadales bacterium]
MHYLIPVLALVATLTIAISLVLWGWSSANRPVAWRIFAFTLGCLLLLGISVAPYPLFPVFERARAEAHRRTCVTNLSNLQRALTLYNSDHGAWSYEKWTDGVETYSSPENFRCPEVDEEFAFSMNAAFSMYKSELDADMFGGDWIDPKQVLLFDGIGGRNRYGDADAVQFRHELGTASFLLFEGNVVQFDRKKATTLEWSN